MKKGIIFTSIGFIFSLILAIAGVLTKNGALLGIWSLFCFCFLISIIVLLVKYTKDKRNNRTNKETYQHSNSSQYTKNNSYNNQSKTRNDNHSEYYGWEETGPDAEYELIKAFDERIKKDFSDLPLNLYILPAKMFQKLQFDISSNDIPSALTLQEIALHMEKHIGFSYDKVVVEVVKTDMPLGYTGTHEKFLSTLSKIKIYFSPIYSAYNVLATLAHEIAHAYQQYHGRPSYSNDEIVSEKFTDAVAIYLGFTDIYKEGQRHKDGRIGYLSDNSLRYVDELVKTRYTAEAPLRENNKKWTEITNQANKILKILKMNFELFKNDCQSKELWNKLTKTTQDGLFEKYFKNDYLKNWTNKVKHITQLTESDAKALINELSYEVMILMKNNHILQGINEKGHL